MQRLPLSLAVVLVGVGIAAGILLDRYWLASPSKIAGTAVANETMLAHASRHLDPTYVCPMHSEIVANEPGSCPICGMELVAADRRADGNEVLDGRPVVKISPRVMNNLGVRTTRVTPTTLVRKLETPGFIQKIRPGKRTRIQAPAAGRVERLHVAIRQWVNAGAPLLELRAPDPVVHTDARRERALADSEAGQLQQAVADDAGRGGEAAQRPISEYLVRAPHDGMVMQLPVGEGSSAAQGAELVQLLGPARASVVATAFQRDAAWIQTGQPVEIYLPNVSGKLWKGIVNQGHVPSHLATQNIGLRLSFDVPQHLVKHAMYVKAKIHGETKQDVLAVSADALIRMEHEDRVIVALGEGRFKPVPVQTGMESDGQVEILAGLEEGDEVVVSAQFLLDSESSLQASFRRMTEK